MLLHMSTVPNRSTWIAALLALATAWLCFGLPVGRDAERGFEVDEAEYLTLAIHSVRQAQGKTDATLGTQLPRIDDLSPWRDGIHDSTFGFQSPGLPKLLFGAAGVAAGVGEVSAEVFPRFLPPDLSRGAAKERRLAARELVLPALEPARRVARGLASLIAALLFAIAYSVSGAWAGPRLRYVCGAFAGLLWITSPIAWEASAYVRPGLLPVLFWCAALLATLKIKRPSILATVLGLCCGLATAGKLNGVLLAPLVPILLFFAQRANGLKARDAAKVAALCTPLAAVLSFAVFLVFAPGLWSDTFSGLVQIVRLWRSDLAHQATLAVETIAISSGPMHSLRMGFSGLANTSGPLAGIAPFLGVVLLPLGLAALARGSKCGGQPHVDRAVLAWSLFLLFASAWLIPMDRARYILPMVAPAALVQALLLARLLSLVPRLRTQSEHA
jgi:hypothetical protein